MKSKLPETEIRFYFLVIIAGLIGIGLVNISIQVEHVPLWSKFLSALGTSVFVLVVVALVQRLVLVRSFVSEAELTIRRIVEETLGTRLNIISTCLVRGIRNLHPDVARFYAEEMPSIIQNCTRRFVVIGIGLTGPVASMLAGAARKPLVAKLAAGLEVTFCIVEPHSEAAEIRNCELGQPGAADGGANRTYSFLVGLRSDSKPANLRIKKVGCLLPKCTYICVDDRLLYVIPYFQKTPTACSFVLESHSGDELYQMFMRDVDNLLANATEWDETSNPPTAT